MIFNCFKKKKLALLAVLGLVAITRFYNLNKPPVYVFDEVYHAFTALAYVQNNPAGYEWWSISPAEGTAYEWLHPPIAKLFMAMGILFFGNNSFGWRFFSAVFGILAIYLVYLLGTKFFGQKTGLVAAFLASLDGLLLTQSRIAMNDIFLTVFILAAIFFLWKWFETLKTKPFLLSWFFAGLACSTKWSGIFLLPIFGLAVLKVGLGQEKPKSWLRENYWLMIKGFLLVPLIYFLSYGQFWFQGHTIKQFKELHQQIWWYQTNLKATHDYQSNTLTWPLMLRPVWFWVDYQGDRIANIYNRGNPIIWWSGLLILPFALFQALKEYKKKNLQLGIVILGYFAFWLPWVFSPRIMFLHHYLPAVPFLCLLIAWFLEKYFKNKAIIMAYLLLVVLVFFFFYPLNTGLSVSQNYFNQTLWLESWK